MKKFWFSINDFLKRKSLEYKKDKLNLPLVNFWLAIVILFISILTLMCSMEQTQYAKLQSADILAKKNRAVKQANEECKKSNNLYSGIYDSFTDKEIPCEEVFKIKTK